MPWIVYETTNIVNGKKYIGVHSQDGDDFDGYLGSGKALSAAIRKHGRENFERRTLFAFESEGEAYARESEIVTEEWCNRQDNYNMRPGGVGGLPWHDPEFRARVSARQKAKFTTDEIRAKNSASMTARNADPEFRAKQMAGITAKNADPAFKAKQKARMKARMTARNADPEFRAKSSARMKAQRADPEFQAKQKAGIKAMHADPEFKAKHLAGVRARWADPEFRAKSSARMKARHARRRCEKASSLLCVLSP